MSSTYNNCDYVLPRTGKRCNRKITASKKDPTRCLCYYHHWQVKTYYEDEQLFQKSKDEIKEQRPRLGRPKTAKNKTNTFKIYKFETKQFELHEGVSNLRKLMKTSKYINKETNLSNIRLIEN